MLVNVSNSGSIYDTSASWLLVPGPSDSQYLMQQMPAQISPDLTTYIIANTGGASSPYAWTNEQKGLPTPKEPYIPYLAIIPDYVALSGNALGVGGNVALNMHTGQVYAGGSGNDPVIPGANFAAGYLPTNLGETSSVAGSNTANLLTGAGADVTACYVFCVGANHAYGGDTAVEIGAGIKVPAKGVSGSTGVMKPIFSLPFTPGDQPPAGQ
jgi:filamentous hemagglutinin